MTETLLPDSTSEYTEQIEDILTTATGEKLEILPRLVCYNIANHTNPFDLSNDNARQFIYRMKKLLSAHYLQKRSRL